MAAKTVRVDGNNLTSTPWPLNRYASVKPTRALILLSLLGSINAAQPTSLQHVPFSGERPNPKTEDVKIIHNLDGSATVQAHYTYEDAYEEDCTFVMGPDRGAGYRLRGRAVTRTCVPSPAGDSN